MKNEIDKQFAALIKERKDADHANMVKSMFLANMSHELRTPLNAIIGFSQMISLLTDVDAKTRTEYANNITEGGTLLLNLINNLLDINKIEAGKEKLDCENFNVGEQIQSCLQLVDPALTAENINVRLGFNSNMMMNMDKVKFKQMVLNIVDNSIKYMDTGDLIKISANKDDKSTKIIIEDNGVGMSEEQKKIALSRYGRLEYGAHKKGKKEGSGLGLTIVKSIMEMVHGEFELESEPDVGTKITLTFPNKYPFNRG